MKQMNMAAVDLNLLKTFLAIWELRSLTAAADRLHLSQPAVSHALRRLRDIFDDPLFVRTPTAMVPTDAAMRLHGPIDNALVIIHGALQKHVQFDPSTASRTFQLVMSDMAESYVLPSLMEALATVAPHVSFDVQQMPVDALSSAMRSGDVDIALGYLPGLSAECTCETLLEDEFICMLRNGHPMQKRKLSLEDLSRLRYVYATTNTTGHRLAEDLFRKAGLERDIAVRIPHFTVAPQIVRNTDLALILPRSIAERVNQGRAYRLLSLPFALPPIHVQVHSHTRFASDPGIAWLRSTLVSMFARPAAKPH
ncbi:LysR family transcriptional regulator [Herbaspirillum sp. RV1423]|uniref:LysR family transcriptional regulator n=1 Tax=Herbaspirillum sp. RV1423 TaxID=1443993 RepID=UPI0004B009D5|nr:LysR family transcriptional regulator [Herbaspirillum sp. RV1423]